MNLSALPRRQRIAYLAIAAAVSAIFVVYLLGRLPFEAAMLAIYVGFALQSVILRSWWFVGAFSIMALTTSGDLLNVPALSAGRWFVSLASLALLLIVLGLIPVTWWAKLRHR